MKAWLVEEPRRHNRWRVKETDDRGALDVEGGRVAFHGRRKDLDLRVEDVRVVVPAYPWVRVVAAILFVPLMWVAIFARMVMVGEFNWPPETVGEREALMFAIIITLTAPPLGLILGMWIFKRTRRFAQVVGTSHDGDEVVTNFTSGGFTGLSPELLHVLERARAP